MKALGATSVLSLANEWAKGLVATAKDKIFRFIPESVWEETLTEDSDVSPSNNSSVVLLLTVGDRRYLLTGDAGAEALHRCADVLAADGVGAGSFQFVQVPHHGSRRNVTPTLLDRLLGPKGQASVGTAYVSCPPENPEAKHPAKVTLNGFTRRGYSVYDTSTGGIWHHYNAPGRDDFIGIPSHPFYDQVEAHDG